jgi:hypothetical protein
MRGSRCGQWRIAPSMKSVLNARKAGELGAAFAAAKQVGFKGFSFARNKLIDNIGWEAARRFRALHNSSPIRF